MSSGEDQPDSPIPSLVEENDEEENIFLEDDEEEGYRRDIVADDEKGEGYRRDIVEPFILPPIVVAAASVVPDPALADPVPRAPPVPPISLHGINFLLGIHNFAEQERKSYGIPCPEENSLETSVAKAIVLRCVICGENQIQTVNFPCMHACFCVKCAKPSLNHSKTCPQCRAEYMHISMLYLCYGDATEEDIPSKKRKIE